MILAGKKTWEIRGRKTHVRGKIALIRGGSHLIAEKLVLRRSKWELPVDERVRRRAFTHRINLAQSRLPYAEDAAKFFGKEEQDDLHSIPCPQG